MALTKTELVALLKADFLTIDGLESFTYTDTTSGGNTTQTVDNARISWPEVKAWGEPAVRGYQISSVQLTFPVDEISVTPKVGDYVAVDSNTYEVTKADKATAFTRWRLTAERAYLESDWVETVTVQRATLTVDIAGSVVETYANVGSYSAAIMYEDDVADMINRLGVRGDKQATTVFFAQSVPVLPMDRLLIDSKLYRITMIGDEDKISRLKKVRVELYA